MMNKHLMFCLAAVTGVVSLFADVRNGNFSRIGVKPPDDAMVQETRKRGIKYPDAKDCAQFWGTLGNDGSVEYPREKNGNRFARFSGKSMMLSGSHYGAVHPDTKHVAITFDIRGKGDLYINLLSYKKVGPKNPVFVTFKNGGVKPVGVSVDCTNWTRFLVVMEHRENIVALHPTFTALSGTFDIDNISMYVTPAHEVTYAIGLGEEKSRLHKLHKMDGGTNVDATPEIRERIEIYRKQDAALQKFVKENPSHVLAGKLLKESKAVRPYLLTEGLPAIRRERLNRAMALSFAIETLTGSKVLLKSSAAPQEETPQAQKKRNELTTAPADAKFEITDLKPGSRLYKEGDTGSAKCRIVSQIKTNQKAILQAFIHSGINDKRLVYTKNLTLTPGKPVDVRFSFKVGDESFGRAVELVLKDYSGKVLAQGREFFQAHKEFMRVMLHSITRYQNVFHLFGHESSNFAVMDPDAERYLCPELRVQHKKYLISIVKSKRNQGYHYSFYQNRGFSAQTGIEQVRKHPDYILYKENGQPEQDPFYGGVPDPFEIASPVELEPVKRKKILDGRDFLDIKITGTNQMIADFANLDCIRFGAKCIRDYQKSRHLNIVYLDDCPAVLPGYTIEGKYNIAGLSKKDIAELNAKIATTWNAELRKDNPDVGSWCNGANPKSIQWLRRIGMWERTMGMGVDVDKGIDVSDEYIRAMTTVPNSMFLSEVQHHIFFDKYEMPYRYPTEWLKFLVEQRDYMVQKYKASVIVGYMCFDTPPIKTVPRNRYWPTLNYFLSLFIATQHHHALLSLTPGLEAIQPCDQFMTRYSGLLWDKEIIAMKKEQAVKTVQLKSKAKLLYEDFIYTRKYDNSEALIAHFVRPYPLEKWDLEWDMPASILKDVEVTVTIPEGKKPILVKAMRPYDVHEKNEIVEKVITNYKLNGNKLTCTLPPFSYYNMLVVQYQ